MARVPLLAKADLTKVINGPIPYTPDGNPLIGPMPGVPNAFEACVFTFGICQAGGAGKVLAEWVTEGATEWDMWSCDPRRFTGFEDARLLRREGRKRFTATNTPSISRTTPGPRGGTRSFPPSMTAPRRWAAQFGAYNGWERALWYARPGDDTSEAAQQTWQRKGRGSPRVAEECEAVRDAAASWTCPAFRGFMLTGPGRRRLACQPDHRQGAGRGPAGPGLFRR